MMMMMDEDDNLSDVFGLDPWEYDWAINDEQQLNDNWLNDDDEQR